MAKKFDPRIRPQNSGLKNSHPRIRPQIRVHEVQNPLRGNLPLIFEIRVEIEKSRLPSQTKILIAASSIRAEKGQQCSN